jgi:hypothetical protein
MTFLTLTVLLAGVSLAYASLSRRKALQPARIARRVYRDR